MLDVFRTEGQNRNGSGGDRLSREPRTPLMPTPVPTPVHPSGFLGSFKKGTENVLKTGLYKLHEGEAVIPKDKKEQNMDSVKDVLGGAETKHPPKEIKHITHRRTKNGGHIIEHHYTHPEHHKSEEHSFDDTDNMMNHFMDHATDQNPGEAEANAGNSGIPEVAPQGV